VLVPELGDQLDLVPFIDLGIPFDAKTLLQEALQHLDKFVVHRPYDQSSREHGHWKSLGIRAQDGDYTKTEYSQNHVDAPNFKFTEIADKCPETLKLIDSLTDVKRCGRIRFMLLDPGARIECHADEPDEEVATAINISLNMPSGCNFFIDTNTDGSHNPYTQKVPFDNNGSAMLINIAKYHYVVNNSTVPRIHIIINGPAKMTEAKLLKRARQQNQLYKYRGLVRELLLKKIRLGQTICSDHPLFSKFRGVGLDDDTLPESIKILVLYDTDQSEAINREALHHFTLASLFPLRCEIIESKQLDAWLKDNGQKSYTHIVIVSAGTLITDLSQFFIELLVAVSKMQEEKVMLVGHIMDFHNHRNDIPYLHEQFAILDYQLWHQAGCPMFEPKERVQFPKHYRSTDNVHGNYTPLFLNPKRPGKRVWKRKGKGHWATQLIAEGLRCGHPVINVSCDLRNTKMYAYPAATDKKIYDDVKNVVRNKLDYSSREVYYFNNEPLLVNSIHGFKPDQLVCVAAGFKFTGLLKQYWPNCNPQKVHFLDCNQHSIKYIQGLFRLGNQKDIVDYIYSLSQENPSAVKLTKEQIYAQLEQILVDYFDGDENLFRRNFRRAKPALFSQVDFLKEHEKILAAIGGGPKTLFWHSNAWFSNAAYFNYTADELEANYCQLGQKIKAKLGMRAWRVEGRFDMLFGDNLDDIHTVLTSGTLIESVSRSGGQLFWGDRPVVEI